MSTLLALACLTSLGFCVEELPDLLRRQRLAREQLEIERERSEARLALAIDAKWREFGCARGLTDEELARTRRATTAKHPPPVGPSPIQMKTMAEASSALAEFGRRVGAPARPWIVNPRTIRPRAKPERGDTPSPSGARHERVARSSRPRDRRSGGAVTAGPEIELDDQPPPSSAPRARLD